MNHPPIPPNCEFFSNEHWFNMRGIMNTHYEACLKPSGIYYNPTGKEREIIAAIARCAWLDEINNLDKLYGDSHLDELNKICDKICAANLNVEAWRLWGENKFRG